MDVVKLVTAECIWQPLVSYEQRDAHVRRGNDIWYEDRLENAFVLQWTQLGQ